MDTTQLAPVNTATLQEQLRTIGLQLEALASKPPQDRDRALWTQLVQREQYLITQIAIRQEHKLA